MRRVQNHNGRRPNNLFQNINRMAYGETTNYQLFDSAKNSREMVQKLRLIRKIPAHNGCVNSICWNEKGNYILSGSDDQQLAITNGYNYAIEKCVETGHNGNIFCAKFLPNSCDLKIVSCSGDGVIIYSDLLYPDSSLNNKFLCHKGTAYEVITVPNDPHTFLSCGEDKSVRWFDVRTKTSCLKEECVDDILIHCQSTPVTSISINNYVPYQLAVGCGDGSVRIFDRRMLSTSHSGNPSNGLGAMMACFSVPEFTQNRRITSLCYSNDGEEVLVSYSSDYIYLFDVKDDLNKDPRLLLKFVASDGTNAYASPLRKLRFRGDWSDTGPNARPEQEDNTAPRLTAAQRMSSIISRIFSNSRSRESRSTSTSQQTSDVGSSSQSAEIGTQTERLSSVPTETAKKDVPKRKSISPPNVPGDSCEPSTSKSAFDEKRLKTSLPSLSREETEICSTNDPQSSANNENRQQSERLSDEPCDIEMQGNGDEIVENAGAKAKDLAEKNQYAEQSTSTSEVTSSVVSNTIDSNPAQCSEQTDDNIQTQESEGITSTGLPPVRDSSTFAQEQMEVEDSVEDADLNQSYGPSDLPDFILQLEQPPQLVTNDNNLDSRCKKEIHEDSADKNGESSTSNELHFDHVTQPRMKKKYMGHRNARTMIKEATFWGKDFVMSGSDCGHIFIWDKNTAELVMLMEGDHHVVNCLQPHPFDPIFASSGIDYDIKLWAPIKESAEFDLEKAEEIMKRNEVMLEETKDTITIPASFMFRMLSALSSRNVFSQDTQGRLWRRLRRVNAERNFEM